MKSADLLVKCLENEGVQYIFGIPGEENLDVMDALLDSPIEFITVRHEQGAAFMADVYGRLTGKAGVCMSTLGPGATNLITGVADANMDRAPVVAIAGQGSTTRMHKESHQILDLVNLFVPITKYSTQIREPEIVPEVVRKAFKLAQEEKPGACFIDFPENIAEAETDGEPIPTRTLYTPAPLGFKLEQAAKAISDARHAVIIAGNGVIRQDASAELVHFAETLNIPVCNTFMAKGVMPFSNELSLGTLGLKARDVPWFAVEKADAIICIGYDMVEYHPDMWNPHGDKTIIHIDTMSAEIDEEYIVAVEVVGHIPSTLKALSEAGIPAQKTEFSAVRQAVVQERSAFKSDNGFPVKPQKMIWDLRQVLEPDDIVISDVGAHKMWIARMYAAERPNTCIISNGFASMGIALPGAIAAKLAYPERKVVAATGDAGFLMNSQEIETALRLKLAFVILIWNDSEYGLITWHQMREFGRPSHIEFSNPDFIKYAESFGAKGFRVNSAEEFRSVMQSALECDTVAIVDCPVDYKENMKLTENLGDLVSLYNV
jgi:acetolactate synthase I/II/III large subunit